MAKATLVYAGRAPTGGSFLHVYYGIDNGSVIGEALYYNAKIHPSRGIGSVWAFDTDEEGSVYEKTASYMGEWQGHETAAWEALNSTLLEEPVQHIDTFGVSFDALKPFKDEFARLPKSERSAFIGRIVMEIVDAR